jgi:uncharacterized protein
MGRNETGVRDSHILETRGLMNTLVGFVIALAVGLTGIGGGSFTVPALVLLAGLPSGAAVGTAFVFAGVLRLMAVPFYTFGNRIHFPYLWLLLKGAIPGLVIGTLALEVLNRSANISIVVVLLGVLLTASSTVTFVPPIQNRGFVRKNLRWLPWLAIPIGIESGFSSAGAGALGTALLLNYSEMEPREVVGTDLTFGLALAVIGSLFHWSFGSVSEPVLAQLLAGGVPGVIVGCAFAGGVPSRKLRKIIAAIAILAGLQLVWSGAHAIATKRTVAGPAFPTSVQVR